MQLACVPMEPCIGLALCSAHLQPSAGSSITTGRDVVVISSYSEEMDLSTKLRGTRSWLYIVEIVQQEGGYV